MTRYLGIFLMMWGLTFSAGNGGAAESPYLLPGGQNYDAPSVSTIEELRRQAERHVDNRDQAYANLQDAETRLSREFWITTIVKEEASRLLMLIRAMKELQRIDARHRERMGKIQLLIEDPQVQRELAGMKNMLSRIRELAADESENDEQEIDQMEQNLVILCRMYSSENTAEPREERSIEPQNEFRLLALQYSKLQKQFDSMNRGTNI